MQGEPCRDAAESLALCTCGNSRRENREIPWVSVQGVRPAHRQAERSENVTGGTADMNAQKEVR